MQCNQSLTTKQLIELHVQEHSVKRLQLFLDFEVQWRATTKSEHAGMIGENDTDKAALSLAESLSSQLYHQFTRRKAKFILQVIVEVTKRYTEFVGHQPPHGAFP